MNKESYKEKYKKVSDFLWPIEKKDKITMGFNRDLSDLSKNINYSKDKKSILFEQVFRIIKGKGG